jgi:hypothetical protein
MPVSDERPALGVRADVANAATATFTVLMGDLSGRAQFERREAAILRRSQVTAPPYRELHGSPARSYGWTWQ